MDADRKALALQLLKQAVADHPKGKAGVAIRLGYGRPLIARTLSPNDPLEMSAALADRVIDRLHVIPECPGNFQAMPHSECRRISTGPAPTHHPGHMHIWKTCQTCPHKPEKKS